MESTSCATGKKTDTQNYTNKVEVFRANTSNNATRVLDRERKRLKTDNGYVAVY